MTSKLLSFKKWHFPNETVLTQAAQAEFQGHILVYYLIKQQNPHQKNKPGGLLSPCILLLGHLLNLLG